MKLPEARSSRQRLPLHPKEKAFLAILICHLCFLPWARGTMEIWNQLANLGFALAEFVCALLPREYVGPYSPDGTPFRLTTGRRLIRFPIFWIGAALLGYILLQISNPSWYYHQTPRYWTLIRLRAIPWLPTSIHAPFQRFNAWRTLVNYSAAWLTVCSAWIALSRRFSIRIVLAALVANAAGLGVLLVLERINSDGRAPAALVPFIPRFWVASFVYKNHAGAYFAFNVFPALALALWFADHGRRQGARSTPAGLFALAAAFVSAIVLFSLSRGATITLTFGAAALGIWLLVRAWQGTFAWKVNPPILVAIAALATLLAVVSWQNLDFSAPFRGLGLLAGQKEAEVDVHSRLLADRASWLMLKDKGLRGIGAGGFQYLFPEYVRFEPEIYDHGRLFWDHAHCDWLEIPIELGAVGDVLLLLGVLWWAGRFRRSHCWNSPIVIPVLAGCFQTLLHATFDFPFQCPPILTTWCLLVALAGRWAELDEIS